MIPLMNISRQYESIQNELDEAALRVLHSGKYILGKEVAQFEEAFAAYCGVKYAVGVGNGTDALVIALHAAGVGFGDEVITCAMSFIATAEAIQIVGATPVFVDCTEDTYTIDPSSIESKITNRTKAILPVHLYGQCADMDVICEIAQKHHLLVIEDCAQAAGAEYKGRKAGSLGDIGCVSFFPTKNLGCAGDGGIILTDQEEIYLQCLAYRMHGSGYEGLFAYGKKNQEPIPEDFDFHGNLPKYYNFVLGYNSRLDTLQAALLNVKLPYLDVWNDKRREIAANFDAGIKNKQIQKPYCAKINRHIYYTYSIQVEDRDAFRNYMKQNDITTGVYFPVAMHLQKVFENLGYQKGDMVHAEHLAEHVCAIPMFAELTPNEVSKIIDTINNYGEKNG